jgi:hypothetical protein
MKVADYARNVLTPGNVAVSRLRMNGLPISRERIAASMRKWDAECAVLEEQVREWGSTRGLDLKFSKAHRLGDIQMFDVLYGPKGLALPVAEYTDTGKASTAAGALMQYASLMNPRQDDDPTVRALLKLRALNKAASTYAVGYSKFIRPDGCLHPGFSWALRTARLSAERPNTQNITERADRSIADDIKSWFEPRLSPVPTPEEWDPRAHGSVWRWDISGAEAVIRIACIATRLGFKDEMAYEYLRRGKDIHSKTACLIFGKPEGTFKKGDLERDGVGKNTTFAKIFGAQWKTVQRTVWQKARHWLDDEQAEAISDAWEAAYPGVMDLYEQYDKVQVAEFGYVEDGYGRRRHIDLPQGVTYGGLGADGRTVWHFPRNMGREEYGLARWKLDNAFHIAANSPTQSMNASDCIWMLALTSLGEYVPLALPPIWRDQGLMFPEAEGWTLNEGPGPGGEPLQSWYTNTVHDSGWGDCAPGRHLESTAKVVWRRCQALPMDWRIETDTPYRVEFKVGPDQAHLMDYSKAAKKFGFEPLPEYRSE